MKIKIILPVFNDWEALKLLMEKTAQLYKNKPYQISFLAVDDCSSIAYKPEDFKEFDIDVLHLISNQGHQRAIAIGLSYFADHCDADKVIVMDSDGEDMPEHIDALVEKSATAPDKIIFAQRKKRTESLLFRVFYRIYKFVFKMLTGNVITFGNYSLIPSHQVKKLANVSELWNHYPGAIMRSRLPFDSVPLDRGTRLAGKSKMNFSSLVLHGMSAVSVFVDVTAVRIVMFAGFMIVSSVVGVLVVLYFKFVLGQATPGWATSVISGLFIVFIQGFFIAMFILFMVLSSRRYTSFIPYFGYKKYIDHVQ
jgi:glycosyltransferase involved in cell wall biosynthesis